MTNLEVENKIKKAAENATPNIKDRVVQKCKNEASSNVACFQLKKNREKFFAIIAVAAMFVIVAKVVFGLVDDSIMKRITTTVDIDVNPSLELQINKFDKVVEAVALNDDAIKILDGMDLHGVQTKIAVNAIVGSMFEHGYLSGDTNTVLISVDGKDKEQASNTKANVTADVDSLLKAYNPNAYVISQDITEGSEIEAMINTYHISSGKASLIKKILDNTDKYTIDELVKLNITELNNIINKIGSIAVIDNQLFVILDDDESTNASENSIKEDKFTDINEDKNPNYIGGSENADDPLTDRSTISNNSSSKNIKNDKSVSNNELKKKNNKKSKNVGNKENQKDTNKDKNDKNKSSNKDKSKKNKKSSDGVNPSNDVSINDVSNNDVSNNEVSENDVSINNISGNDVSDNDI